MDKIFGLFLGAKFQLIAIVLALSVAGGLVWDYKHTKAELVTARAQVAQDAADIKQIQTDIATYQKNQETLNTMFAAQRGLVIQQEKVRTDVHTIPVKGTDHPFADDSGLLERAKRLRDYQQGGAQAGPK